MTVETSVEPVATAAPVTETDRLRDELTAAHIKIDNLSVALESSRRIGTAMGIVMAQRRLDVDAAFDVLRTASQHSHRKLRDLADDVIYTGSIDAALALALEAK